MSRSHEHRRLKPVHAVLLLIVVLFAMLSSLFADETRAQAQVGRAQRQQREQRTNADRESAFYQSASKQQAQQQRDETRKWLYEHPRFRGSRSRGGSGVPYYGLRR